MHCHLKQTVGLGYIGPLNTGSTLVFTGLDIVVIPVLLMPFRRSGFTIYRDGDCKTG